VFDIPLAEVVTDYFDQLKSRSKGYASMEYKVGRCARSARFDRAVCLFDRGLTGPFHAVVGPLAAAIAPHYKWPPASNQTQTIAKLDSALNPKL